MVGDEQAIRDAVATLRNQIEQERAFTSERVERLRRFIRGREFEQREREEWQHFHDRTRVMQQEIDVIVSARATVEGLRQPAPLIIPREE